MSYFVRLGKYDIDNEFHNDDNISSLPDKLLCLDFCRFLLPHNKEAKVCWRSVCIHSYVNHNAVLSTSRWEIVPE